MLVIQNLRCYTPRYCNSIADRLAKLAKEWNTRVWTMEAPSCIKDMLGLFLNKFLLFIKIKFKNRTDQFLKIKINSNEIF